MNAENVSMLVDLLGGKVKDSILKIKINFLAKKSMI
jgi:hypothetical protein